MNVIAIDPGSVESAFVVWDGRTILDYGKRPNNGLLAYIASHSYLTHCAVEQIRGYGLVVGNEVFDTCFFAGRCLQLFGEDRTSLLPRKTIVTHLCDNPRAKDGDVRAALIDRIGAPGTKKEPGPTYGISSDCWAALAVAVTWWDRQAYEKLKVGA